MDAHGPDVTDADPNGEIARFEAQHTVAQAMSALTTSERRADRSRQDR